MEDLEGFKKKIESDIKRYETGSVILLPFLDEAKGYIVEELCNKYKVIYYKNGGIINSSKNRSGDLITKAKLRVNNLDTLNLVIRKLNSISNIYSIDRIKK